VVRPLSEFGGWLRVFQISLWLNLIIASFSALGVLFIQSKLKTTVGLWTLFAHQFCIVVLYCVIAVYLSKKNPKTPQNIRKAFIAIGSLGILTLVLYGFFLSFPDKSDSPPSVVASIQLFGPKIVWTMIWASYFSRSERVHQFYGD
jgi:uncharacterized protein DUF2569